MRVGDGRERDSVSARADAEIGPGAGVPLGMPSHGTGGGCTGPLLAEAFDAADSGSRRSADGNRGHIGRSVPRVPVGELR